MMYEDAARGRGEEGARCKAGIEEELQSVVKNVRAPRIRCCAQVRKKDHLDLESRSTYFLSIRH